jgi:SNF2 family DNA or RNA helicase
MNKTLRERIRQSGNKAQESKETQQNLDDRVQKIIPDNPPEPNMMPSERSSAQLYQHQIEDIARFRDADFGAIFNSAGTGKSLTTIRIIEHKYIKGEIDSLLLVAPNGVHVQWAREQIPLWLNVPYEVVILGGRLGVKKTKPFRSYPGEKLHIVCCNYDLFSTKDKWKDVAFWAINRKTAIVADEGTAIKSVKAQRTQRLLYGFNNVQRRGKAIISSTPLTIARFILTGTPITNGALDLWSMFEFLKPNFFNRNWYSFQNMYSMMWVHPAIGQRVVMNEKAWHAVRACVTCNEAVNKYGVSEDTYNTVRMQDHWSGPYKHLEQLLDQIKPHCTIRNLVDCVDMPEQIYITRVVEPTPEQTRVYYDMKKVCLVIIKDRMASASSKIVALIRLQAITSGFLPTWEYKAPDDYDEDTDFDITEEEAQTTWISDAKVEALLTDIEAVSGEPILVITHFTAEAAHLYETLSQKYRTCLQTGWKKIGTIEEFQKGEYDVMVANIRVISKGFNLQNSHRMFYYSNTYSLEDRIQSEARIFRVGQTQKCIYTDYVVRDTIDEDVVKALQGKRALFEYIMSQGD